MAWSLRLLALSLLVLALASCSAQAPSPAATKAATPPGLRTATLHLTPGLRVVGHVAMPRGFVPAQEWPPLWLQNGKEIAVAGVAGGRFEVFGFSGPDFTRTRVLAAESGPFAAEEGTILDIAASPDGMTLASAVSRAGEDRLDLILRDLIASGPGHPLLGFDGRFAGATLSWLNSATIALVPERDPRSLTTGATAANDRIQMIVVTGEGSAVPLKLDCELGPLQWSPRGIYAVSTGGDGVAPVLIDRRRPSCTPLKAEGSINVLGWAHDESAFLYSQSGSRRHPPAVYEYDIATGVQRLVAVSSSAAVLTSTDAIVALGNRSLTQRLASERPELKLAAELAMFEPDQPAVRIRSLGFQTLSGMLAESFMTYSKASDRIAIGTFSVTPGGPVRKIVLFSLATGRAFLLANGKPRGNLSMSWSPRGRLLAIADGDTSASTLTVLSPWR